MWTSEARTVIGRGAAGRRTRSRRLAAELIAIGALVAIPGLAMADALPDPAQHAVSSVLDKVGISVPQGNGVNTDTSGVHPASTGADISSLATTTDGDGQTASSAS